MKRPRVPIIYTFILKSYIGPLIFTFFIALFILLMQFLWKYVDDLVGKGFDWYIIGELLFYASATFVPLALPLAILLASLMTFGNLGEHYELVAMKASGISFRKAMFPLVVFSVFISGCAFFFSNNILPRANLKFGSLLYDVREKKPALNINEGIFYNEIDDYVIRIGKKDDDGKTIRNVIIYDHSDKAGNNNVTVAEYGSMESTPDNRYLIFKLYNGYNYSEQGMKRENASDRPLQRTKFEEEIRRFDLSAFKMNRSNEELFKDHYQMMNLNQLNLTIDTLLVEYLDRDDQMVRFMRNSFYSYSLTDTSRFVKSDTIKPLNDDFLANFNPADRKRYIETAIASARGASQYYIFSDEDLAHRREVIARHKIEWHRKFTLSIACLILFFIGAPLGAIIRKGGLGMPVVFATIFFIMYHVVSMTGEKFAREGVMPAWEGMWIASLVFLPIGVLLTYTASTDAPILSLDFWTGGLKRMWRFITRRPAAKKISAK